MSVMDPLLNAFSSLFEVIRRFWEKESTHRFVSRLLVITFIAALAAIEMNRQGWLPQFLAGRTPTSHYMAINLAFSLVLILEVISMIFTLPGSMSRALGKQFEILALIFLRTAFKELSYLPEPMDVSGHNDVLWHILSYGGGAVVIFALLGLYRLCLERLDETIAPGPALDRFIKAKKCVSLLILVIFTGMGLYSGWHFFRGSHGFHFFKSFYTVLIFSDVFLVLIAQSFLPRFPAVFRNSGYALATLLIRMSLTSPIYYNVLIGIASVIFAIVLTAVYNRFYTLEKETDKNE